MYADRTARFRTPKLMSGLLEGYWLQHHGLHVCLLGRTGFRSHLKGQPRCTLYYVCFLEARYEMNSPMVDTLPLFPLPAFIGCRCLDSAFHFRRSPI